MRNLALQPTNPRPTLHAPHTAPVPTNLTEIPLRLPGRGRRRSRLVIRQRWGGDQSFHLGG